MSFLYFNIFDILIFHDDESEEYWRSELFLLIQSLI